jgi:hypothetical protein
MHEHLHTLAYLITAVDGYSAEDCSGCGWDGLLRGLGSCHSGSVRQDVRSPSSACRWIVRLGIHAGVAGGLTVVHNCWPARVERIWIVGPIVPGLGLWMNTG